MKKLFLGITLGLIMAGALATSAFGMTMEVSNTTTLDSTYNDRSFKLGVVTLTEDRANELTPGDNITLALPDGANWDRDNTVVYRYVDGKKDGELKKGVDFQYEDDRKLKFSFKTVSGNVETFEIQPYVKLYGFMGNKINLSLWQSNLAAFNPKEVALADNKDLDQEKTISISVEGTPVQVTRGDKQTALSSIRITEEYMSSFRTDDEVEISILTPGVTFDNSTQKNGAYYYPVKSERVHGDNIFTSATMGSSQTASFTITKRSESATTIRVALRSVTISNSAQPGDIQVRVQAGTKSEVVTVGTILEKNAEQLAQEAADEAELSKQQPKIGRSVFKLNSLQYTFMDQQAIMTSAPYSRNGVTFLPASVLANVLGVTESNYIWNSLDNRITLKGGRVILEMKLGSTEAKLNGMDFTMNSAPEYWGTSINLPLREVAQIFGYSVNWVQSNQSIVIDPPAAAEVPVETVTP